MLHLHLENYKIYPVSYSHIVLKSRKKNKLFVRDIKIFVLLHQLMNLLTYSSHNTSSEKLIINNPDTSNPHIFQWSNVSWPYLACDNASYLF